MAWTEKLPSGKYRGLYRLPDGSKRSVTGTFPHKRAALLAASTEEDLAQRPGWRDPKAAATKWGAWAKEWWDFRDVSEATLKHEASMFTKHIEPRWKEVPLADITRHEVRQWANLLKRNGLEASSVNRVMNVFRASLSAAVDAEVLAYNPASRVHLEVGQKDVRRYLTLEEANSLMGNFQREHDEKITETLFGSGLRFGEMAGLQVNRVSRNLDAMRVAESWITATRSLAPYTKSRMIRDVPIPPSVAEVLEPLVKGRKTGFVFERAVEQVPEYNNFRKRFLQAAEKAELGKVTIHDTRHTYASWLLQNGISLAEVGDLLGHVDPTTTQIYAHLAPKSSEHIFDALPTLSRGARRGAERGATDNAHPVLALSSTVV